MSKSYPFSGVFLLKDDDSVCLRISFLKEVKETDVRIMRLLRLFENSEEICDVLEDLILTCACSSCVCDEREDTIKKARKLLARINGIEEAGND